MSLDPWKRLQAADRLIDLIAVAIRLRHPQAARMAAISLPKLDRLSDEQLLAATVRLERWIDEQSTVAGSVNAAVALTGGPAVPTVSRT